MYEDLSSEEVVTKGPFQNTYMVNQRTPLVEMIIFLKYILLIFAIIMCTYPPTQYMYLDFRREFHTASHLGLLQWNLSQPSLELGGHLA